MSETITIKEGGRTGNGRAPALKQFLDEIYKEEGSIRPRSVWLRSQPEDAEFHNAFEWDNDEAADLYRDHQARRLIGSVVVTKQGQTTRAYCHVTVDESCYMPISTVVTVESMMAEVIADAIGYLEAAKRRLEGIKALQSEAAAVYLVVENLKAKKKAKPRTGRTGTSFTSTEMRAR